MKQGDYDRAISDYTQSLGVDPNLNGGDRADRHKSRGIAYEKKGDIEHAKADFKESTQKIDYCRGAEVGKTSLEHALARTLRLRKCLHLNILFHLQCVTVLRPALGMSLITNCEIK
jgi:tetratricopeptide (TPR) repeat protein